VVLALSALNAVAPLRRRLQALAPQLRVHALAMTPGCFDALTRPARQQLH
jgi:hypothetical protein